jgi:hypothetical protein
MSELASAVFDTVWNLGLSGIVATDYLVSRVEEAEPYTMEPFAMICSPQQLFVVKEALDSIPTSASLLSSISRLFFSAFFFRFL